MKLVEEGEFQYMEDYGHYRILIMPSRVPKAYMPEITELRRRQPKKCFSLTGYLRDRFWEMMDPFKVAFKRKMAAS